MWECIPASRPTHSASLTEPFASMVRVQYEYLSLSDQVGGWIVESGEIEWKDQRRFIIKDVLKQDYCVGVTEPWKLLETFNYITGKTEAEKNKAVQGLKNNNLVFFLTHPPPIQNALYFGPHRFLNKTCNTFQF